MTYCEFQARIINRWRERTRKIVNVKCKNFQKYESHRKLLERYGGSLPDGIGRFFSVWLISGFPSTNYAEYYSTKRKSAKIASGSSLQLISYSSIFASNFWICCYCHGTIMVLSMRELETSNSTPHCIATACHVCSTWLRASESGVQWSVCCIVCWCPLVPLCPLVSSVSR